MKNIIDKAAGILRNGGVVVFPTETVYGIGASVFDEKAVARIFEIKKRPRFDPLIVHVSGRQQLSRLVKDIPPKAKSLIEKFWPGPLTLVLNKKNEVPHIVTAGLSTVAVRMPSHPMALELIAALGTPIAAPSANVFGSTSPTTAAHVLSRLEGKVDLIVDGGSCLVGIESTIVSLTGEKPVVLRTGGTSIEDIEKVIGGVARGEQAQERPNAPGQFYRHYAPRTPLVLWGKECRVSGKTRTGFLAFRKPPDGEFFAAVEVLSESGNLREAAVNLFGAIHKLDAMGLDLIAAELVPDTGLGVAINDRLRRAVFK